MRGVNDTPGEAGFVLVKAGDESGAACAEEANSAGTISSAATDSPRSVFLDENRDLDRIEVRTMA